MDGWQAVYALRERVTAVLVDVVEGRPDAAAAAAAELLDELRAVWIREKRWRNDRPRPQPVLHEAGAVIACREHRPSCPGFIVDRRQTCTRCGRELVRGRWSMFYDPGQLVARLGTVTYPVVQR